MSHLYWARLLLANILIGNGTTIDTYIPPYYVWFGKYQNRPYYLSIADCSSFMNELLKFSYHLSDQEFTNLMGNSLPVAQTYYDKINKNQDFIRITNIHQV